MSGKLIITKHKGQILSSLFEENDLIQVNAEKEEAQSILGSLYLGRVKNIVKNINAAFVEIENGQMCYLSLSEGFTPLFACPKKNNNINTGDTLVIQISREDVKTKGPLATAAFGFTGKYAALTYGKTRLGISSKITSKEERSRLRGILTPYENDKYGLVIRTNSEGVPREIIEREIKLLTGLYENVLEFGIHKHRFSCIYHAPKSYLCNIRDGVEEDLEEIVTDDKELYEEIKEYLNCYQPEDLEKLRLFEDSQADLNRIYNIETKLSKALAKHVWLKSGAYLVVEHTEALTVIDVNTGKAIKGRRRIEETFRKVNLEAAKEAAKQIRLRNLSGIIIIDFIDMEAEEDKAELLDMLRGYLSKDPVPAVLVDMTPLGLAEITRKKVRKPLHEQLKNSII